MNKVNKTKILLFISYLIIVALLTKPYSYGDNEGSRFNTIKALVEHKTFAWNELSYYYISDDKILVRGRVYSDKQPMFAFLSAPVYYLIYSFGITFDKYPGLTTYLLKMLIVGAATAFLLVLFYQLLEKEDEKKDREKIGKIARILLTLTLGFSTLLFSYATTFNSHSITALLLFASFYLYIEIINKTKESTAVERSYFFLFGLLLGLTVAIDMVVGVFFAVGFLFYFFFLEKIRFNSFKIPFSSKVLICIALLLPVILHSFFNYLILGNLFLPAYAFPQYYKDAGTWQNETNLPGFYNHASLTALLEYSFHSIFGARGFFSYSPALFFGFCFLCYSVFFIRKISALPILFATLGIFGYYLLYTNNYGGSSYGIRYLLPLTPILIFFCKDLFYNKVFYNDISCGSKYINFARVKLFFYLSILFGFIVALVGVFNPWTNHGSGIESISFVASLHLDIVYNTAIHYLLHWIF